jgi:hypothetical protein
MGLHAESGGTQLALVHVGGRGSVFNFTLLESFECPLCEDFGIVEVWVEPAFGLTSEGHKAETEWRVCECRKNEALAATGERS